MLTTTKETAPAVNSKATVFWFELFWKALGLSYKPHTLLSNISIPYDLLLSICITCGFPLHLVVGVARSHTYQEVINNLVMCISSVSCTLKHVIYRRKLRKMDEVMQLFRQLDDKATSLEERQYYRRFVWQRIQMLLAFFFVAYYGVGTMGTVGVIMDPERRLVYPAFIPFDWSANTLNYVAAVSFQIIGVFVQTTQNVTNDLYGAVTFCIFAGHVRLLSMRVSRLGLDKEKSALQHNKELIESIEDYSKLLRIYKLVQNIISYSYLAQFLGVGLNMCVAVVYLIFFADELVTYAYYGFHILAIILELLPSCYYGTALEYEFFNFTNAIFSCNWYQQDRTFRRHIFIFAGLTLKPIALFAGNMIKIHLGAFVETFRLAYAFFTLIQKLN